MKLGIFDSGLGGLIITKAIRQHFPDIDILYFGDTLHLPYGNRSHDAIYDYSKRAIEFLFKHDCNLIITACNTVSASALRQLQQSYLPKSPYADRRILGVIVPTLETALDQGFQKIGLIATNFTIESKVYEDELKKLSPNIELFAKNTPLLVPLIEDDGHEWVRSVLERYLQPLKENNIECLILGCTHYGFLKPYIQEVLGEDVTILSQDDIIPAKLEDYLNRHPEISNPINRNSQETFIATDITPSYQSTANKIYGTNIAFQKVVFSLEQGKYVL